MVEDVVRHVAALGDPLRFVEGPVNAKINATLAVLFLSLGKRREGTGHIRAHVAVMILCHSVEFVGHKREADGIGAEEPA